MARLIERLKRVFTGDPPSAEEVRRKEAEARIAELVEKTHVLRAKVDAAQTTPENQRHWAAADSFAADWAYDPATRWTLRRRARHEATNNCYAKGAVRSAADDMIGTGPRLQLSMPTHQDQEKAEAACELIESEYAAWCDETRHAINLRIAHKSLIRDGGCFGIFDSDLDLEHPVKFCLRWVEDEQCGTPFSAAIDPFVHEGIRFNRLGKPIEYTFFAYHPGSLSTPSLPTKFFTVPANRVIHWFQPDRFGQHRGIPQLTPALPLYAQTRRLTLATLTAAEFAAMLAGVLKTNLPPANGSPTTIADWSFFEMVRGALMSLPEGWEASQFKPEQPATTYPEFKRELLNESGRATNQPLNVITGNSSGYNFSSGRLDHLPYQRGIRIDRNDHRIIVDDPIFREFARDALQVGLVPAELAANLPPLRQWRWTWNYDGFDSIDQNKDAMADDTRIKNGTQTYHETYSAYGQDWKEQFVQLSREKAYAAKLGLPWPVLAAPPTIRETGTLPPNAPATDNAEAAVASALAEVGVSDKVAEQIIEALAPTFAAMREVAEPGERSQRGHGSARSVVNIYADAADIVPERDKGTGQINRLRRVPPSKNGTHLNGTHGKGG